MTRAEGPAADRLILVDVRECQVNRERGIPVYAQSLLLELPNALPEASFLLWHDPSLPPPTQAALLQSVVGPFRSARELMALPPGTRFTDLLTACIFQDHKGPLAAHLFPAWLRAHQPQRLGIVYDLIPYIFRDRYLTDPVDLARYLEGMRCLRSWDQLFAISESARRDAIRYANVDPARIHNIYGGLDPSKAEAIRTGGAPWLGGPLPASYAVYVCGDDWRKNLTGAIQGFAGYQKGGGRMQALVLVCGMPETRRRELLRVAEEACLPPGALLITGKVTDAELIGIVKGAELSLFPSFYEGLGLPVIESYACGIPVLASDRSSLPELVPPGCSFDPDRPSSLAGAMLAFDRDPAIRQASLSKGREVLAALTWPRCAHRLAGIVSASQASGRPAGSAVAMVGVLPPARTGIAPVNARHLRLSSAPVHFFSAFPRASERSAFRSHPWQRLAHPRNLPTFQHRENYSQRLFVLGNSGHHQATLDALRALREAPGQTWLYLHDGDLLGMWLSDFDQDLSAVAALYAKAYPGWRGGAAGLFSPDRPRGLRPLMALGRDIGIIANSRWTRDRMLEDLVGPPALGVHNLFLPVEPHTLQRPEGNGPILRVGTFGKPEKTKQLDRLIAAVGLLGSQRPARLLVAGFDAANFLAKEGLSRSIDMDVIDNPSDPELLEAMRSVDVAVQLRFPSHGESSGVVGHLLGMGIPIVATAAGSFPELGEAVVLVPPDVAPSRLGEAILEAHESPAIRAAASAHRTAHLPGAFVSALDGLLAAHRGPSP